MHPTPLESRFDTYAAYRQAVADTVMLARRELVVFDPDLRETGLESPDMEQALRAFLSAGRANRVRIVVQGGTLAISVNGEALPEVNASGQGQVGVLAIPDSEPNVNGRFDNFRLMTPDCKS